MPAADKDWMWLCAAIVVSTVDSAVRGLWWWAVLNVTAWSFVTLLIPPPMFSKWLKGR